MCALNANEFEIYTQKISILKKWSIIPNSEKIHHYKTDGIKIETKKLKRKRQNYINKIQQTIKKIEANINTTHYYSGYTQLLDYVQNLPQSFITSISQQRKPQIAPPILPPHLSTVQNKNGDNEKHLRIIELIKQFKSQPIPYPERERVQPQAERLKQKQQTPPLSDTKQSKNDNVITDEQGFIDYGSTTSKEISTDKRAVDEAKHGLNEKMSVSTWNWYSIIYWINRVKNGRFKNIDYLNLRKHIFIGKIKGYQLKHINHLTLNMIGIHDYNKHQMILNAIAELVMCSPYIARADEICSPYIARADDIPEMYLDPISYELMNDPVILKTSTTEYCYERKCIENYIKQWNMDPLHKQRAEIKNICENHSLKAEINAWKEMNVLFVKSLS